jgi:hypothetical protein
MKKNFQQQSEQALKEVELRKKNNSGEKKPKEVNGPKGLEPTRYGDWETKGITYDF